MDKKRLHDGVEIPVLGLGVFQARPRETKDAVLEALRLGYRHIDTARIYQNEAEVGAAVRESGLPRSEIFVTTKLWNDDQGYDKARRAFDASLARLGLEYVDLYLIHWPVRAARLDSWRALEKIHDAGLARSIGVSNFEPRHLDELLSVAKKKPTINQVEASPFLAQKELVRYCAKHDIKIEAYSPLTKGAKLNDPIVVRTAQRLGRTPAQILLRWCVEQDFIILPKSVRASRIAENAAVFDFRLDEAAVHELSQLDCGFRTSWDPSSVA